MKKAPRPAIVLGWCGVLPFVGLVGALAFRVGNPDEVSDALRLYGAVILSFMGGVHWGVASLRSEARMSPYAASVLPALWAWLMTFAPAPIGFAGLGFGFAILLAYDLRCVGRRELPHWYGRLRVWLTLAVGVCLITSSVLA